MADCLRRMASNVSGERSPFEGSCCGSGYHTVDSTPLGSPEEIEVPKYRVVMLGDAGVGKTALVSQFMTSEYMNTYDASLDDEFGERTVSVLLDGEESEMIFIDHPSSEMSVENSLSTYEPHACIVVYSVVSRSSFQHAEETLNYLWREGYTHEKSVIVVGNKADLARARVISANEGKALAVARDCKFIETSSGIQHNVDELLVGILKQIRLRESREKKKSNLKKENNKLHGSKTSLSLNIAREILQKICMNDISKSKSCENLHVL
ncbi:ras-related protein Rap-2a-like [Anoplophora glabripennis]|uniref:ras-related protein Rap-2a-like n=1 Tax=Anoplophora glabripennis TaxID=217634 RepID=UPI000C79004B|nr:ras-related protein Rap-2a-like [Anoplophora glabripennis]